MAQGDSRIAICAMMGHEPCDTIGHAPRPLGNCRHAHAHGETEKIKARPTTSANYRLLRATTQKLRITEKNAAMIDCMNFIIFHHECL